MIESNRRIASINRIDELNQRIAFQNDPKRPVDSLMGRQDRSKRPQEPPRAAQGPLKTAQKAPKTLRREPKSPQERPKTTPRRPKTPPRSPLGTVAEPSWDQSITRSKTSRSKSMVVRVRGSILAPKMGPKTTPRRPQNESKIKTKNASLFYRSWTRLGPVLRPSWAHLGVKKVALALRFPMFFEHRLF